MHTRVLYTRTISNLPRKHLSRNAFASNNIPLGGGRRSSQRCESKYFLADILEITAIDFKIYKENVREKTQRRRRSRTPEQKEAMEPDEDSGLSYFDCLQ